MINNPWKGPISRITRTNFSFPSQRRLRGLFLEPRHFPPRLQRSSLPLEAVCIKKNKQNEKKRMTQNIDACVARNDREGRKRSGEKRGKKKRKKKKGRNNETCFQLANKFPLSSILPTLLSSRTRNYASE